MVREAERRKKKFEAKVDAEVLARQTTALKPLMVRGQALYFPDIATVEEKVKTIVEAEGVSTLQVRDYLNFSREMYRLSKRFSSVTLQAEAQTRVNKWVSRGLVGVHLIKIAQLFGITPTAVAPPTVDFIPIWYAGLRVGGLHMSPLHGYQESVGAFWADTLTAHPFPITRKMRISHLAVWIMQGGGVGGLVNIGFYDSDADGKPKNLLAKRENLDPAPTGWIGGDVDLTIEKGLYFFAVLTNKNDVGFCTRSLVASPLGAGEREMYPYGKYYIEYPFAPLPDTFPPNPWLDFDTWATAIRLAELF